MRIAAFLLTMLATGAALAGPQDITVKFGVPITGGAPASYQLFKDGVLVGPAVPTGTVFPSLLADDGTTHVLAIETRNAACGVSPLPACPRVGQNVTINAVLQPPGAVNQIQILAPCALTVPATCTIIVN